MANLAVLDCIRSRLLHLDERNVRNGEVAREGYSIASPPSTVFRKHLIYNTLHIFPAVVWLQGFCLNNWQTTNYEKQPDIGMFLLYL
jgi:hypothetical protein